MEQKILILSDDRDGLILFWDELIAKLRDMGKEVVLCFPDNAQEQLPLLGCQTVSCTEYGGKNFAKQYRLYRFYKRTIGQMAPQLVITSGTKPNIYGGLACRRLGVRHVAKVTGLGRVLHASAGLKTAGTRLYKMALKKTKVIFFENIANLQAFTQNKNVCPSRAVLLSGAGVDLSRFEYSPLPKDVPLTILFIGRITAEKGIEEFLTAAAQLKIKHREKVSFVLIGSISNRYVSSINNMQSDGIITHHGRVEDIRSAILSAHCVVLPSHYEGMSNVLLEAAAMGRPLLASDINGCKELIIDGVSGYLFPAKHVWGLADALEKFITLTDAERAEMGRLSRAHVQRHFDKSSVVERTMESLISVLDI